MAHTTICTVQGRDQSVSESRHEATLSSRDAYTTPNLNIVAPNVTQTTESVDTLAGRPR